MTDQDRPLDPLPSDASAGAAATASPSAVVAPADPAPTEPAAAVGGDAADDRAAADGDTEAGGAEDGAVAGAAARQGQARRRRRGSRGGKGRRRPATAAAEDAVAEDAVAEGAVGTEGDEAGDDNGPPEDDEVDAAAAVVGAAASGATSDGPPRPSSRSTGRRADVELPDRPIEGKIQDPLVADRALVRKPQIGDSRPAPVASAPPPAGRTTRTAARATPRPEPEEPSTEPAAGNGRTKRRRKTSRTGGSQAKGHAAGPVALDPEVLERRRGRERNGRPIGRYLMCVHVRPDLVQIAVLQGRNLIEHYVSRPSDDAAQIHGNIYLGRVQNVLPGMEAAFVDIGTPKIAVLYRGDVQYDQEDLLEPSKGDKGRQPERPRIEQLLKNRQLIVSQVTKNPIGAKGARLTQEVSLPGRFVVLIPNSRTYGISKRLADDERRRLRSILDRVKPEEHGLIVRTAAENVSEDELRADVLRLAAQWEKISAKAKQAKGPALLYREPGLAVRVIREELNADYRGVVIDDPALFAEVRDYVGALNPELADRIELYDPAAEGLPLFERHHVHEQLHKALDRKVWLPSGGSLIIEHTEALTVIDVNTGKNVGTSNLEETVFKNNLEAADEIARQLRLRDIGGIIVIDFIDMEIRENRQKVVAAFREALARDKTRTQVFDISDLGLVEMTRKRIGEGLLTAFAQVCPNCDGRGLVVDHSLIG
jgi:ribonuclease E